MSARLAGPDDAPAAAVLLDRFNREYDEQTPGPEWLTGHLRELMAAGATEVILAGEAPDGLAILRFQPSLTSSALEAYLAELYVTPEARRAGLGTALMDAVAARCEARRCDFLFLGTDPDDTDAHRLYERSGLKRNILYEREL